MSNKRVQYIDMEGHKRFATLDEKTYRTVCTELRMGRKIPSIKLVREVVGMGLRESKDIVENIGRREEINSRENITTPGMSIHRGNPSARIIGLRDTHAWGRNGSFRANKLALGSDVNNNLTLSVWSVREGKHAPIKLELSEVDAVELRHAVEALAPARVW